MIRYIDKFEVLKGIERLYLEEFVEKYGSIVEHGERFLSVLDEADFRIYLASFVSMWLGMVLAYIGMVRGIGDLTTIGTVLFAIAYVYTIVLGVDVVEYLRGQHYAKLVKMYRNKHKRQ